MAKVKKVKGEKREGFFIEEISGGNIEYKVSGNSGADYMDDKDQAVDAAIAGCMRTGDKFIVERVTEIISVEKITI